MKFPAVKIVSFEKLYPQHAKRILYRQCPRPRTAHL